MENKPIKPPLGIIPKHLHDERRAAALMAACVRYYDAFLPVPFEWLAELRAILGDQIECRDRLRTPSKIKNTRQDFTLPGVPFSSQRTGNPRRGFNR